jgi:hypothetical protein
MATYLSLAAFLGGGSTIAIASRSVDASRRPQPAKAATEPGCPARQRIAADSAALPTPRK